MEVWLKGGMDSIAQAIRLVFYLWTAPNLLDNWSISPTQAFGVTTVTASPSFAQGARSRSTSAKNIPNFLRGTITVTSSANSAFVGGHRATISLAI